MDVTTAMRRIKRYFGDEYDILINDDDIFGWLYDAESEIIRSSGQNENVASTTVGTIGVAGSAVPTSVHIKRVVINDVALSHIERDELDMISASEVSPGTPLYWYVVDKKVFLWPIDAASTTPVKIYYNKTPVMITGTAAAPTPTTFVVPEIHHNDLIKYCIARAHDKNKDGANSKVMQDLFDRNIGARRDESMSIDAPIYKIPDPMDYGDYAGMY